jgi:hypothetical protein
MKLSTEKLRELMAGWINTPEIKNYLNSAFVENTVIHWDDWCDTKQWKRESKERLKEEWPGLLCTKYDYKNNQPVEFGWLTDVAGWCDDDLLKKTASDTKQAERCWLRRFVPNNEFGDNFRIEVVTTPDDEQVIAWSLIVD